jgi:cytochrome c oxidase subunit III
MDQVTADGMAVPSLAADWGGGTLPYRVGHKKLGMWLFIVSDSLTFGALLAGYSYVRAESQTWATPFPIYPSILFSTIMTFALLTSSLTMVMAVAAAHRHDLAAARKWIFGTMVGGAIFIILHLMEWSELIEKGLRPFELPKEWLQPDRWPGASPLFGATFFTITGLHMFHVFSGLVYLGVIALRIKKVTEEDVEISGLYWHFVDLVWMFVFPLIYLLSVNYKP